MTDHGALDSAVHRSSWFPADEEAPHATRRQPPPRQFRTQATLQKDDDAWSQFHQHVDGREDLRALVRPESRGPYFIAPPGLAFVRPGDSGLLGLLHRHVGVDRAKWKHCLSQRKKEDEREAQAEEERTAGRRRARHRSIFVLPMLPPNSAPVQLWMGFMLLMDLGYTAFAVPVNVAECTHVYGNSIRDTCTQVDFVGGLLYVLNVLAMFNMGVIARNGNLKATVMSGRTVAWLYVSSWRFFLDITAAIPFLVLVVVLSTSVDRLHSPGSWIHLLSLIRLVRVARMLSISKMLSVDVSSGTYRRIPIVGRFLSVTVMYVTLLVYVLMVVVNLLACILVLQASLQPAHNQTFYDNLTWIDASEEPAAYRWYVAIYWVITTATGTGYGDISPKNITEQVLANINMILGVLIFGMLVGAVANWLTKASASAHKLYSHHKKVAEVEAWLEQRDLDSVLREEIQGYFLQFWGQDATGTPPEQRILADLPSHLRDGALAHITCPLVAQVHGLQLLAPQLQSLIAGALRAVTILPGHDICVQGRDADRLWICETGAVIVLQYAEVDDRVSFSSGPPIANKLARYSRISTQSHPAEYLDLETMGPIDSRYSPIYVPLTTPCLIGESAMLGDDLPACRQRLVTYRAIKVVKAWELRLSDLWPLLRSYPQIKVTMLDYVRHRLVRDLGRYPAPHNHYCELSAVISSGLLKPGADHSQLEDVVMELVKADIESGELVNKLSTLAEVCIVQPWAPPDDWADDSFHSFTAGAPSARPADDGVTAPPRSNGGNSGGGGGGGDAQPPTLKPRSEGGAALGADRATRSHSQGHMSGKRRSTEGQLGMESEALPPRPSLPGRVVRFQSSGGGAAAAAVEPGGPLAPARSWDHRRRQAATRTVSAIARPASATSPAPLDISGRRAVSVPSEAPLDGPGTTSDRTGDSSGEGAALQEATRSTSDPPAGAQPGATPPSAPVRVTGRPATVPGHMSASGRMGSTAPGLPSNRVSRFAQVGHRSTVVVEGEAEGQETDSEADSERGVGETGASAVSRSGADLQRLSHQAAVEDSGATAPMTVQLPLPPVALAAESRLRGALSVSPSGGSAPALGQGAQPRSQPQGQGPGLGTQSAPTAGAASGLPACAVCGHHICPTCARVVHAAREAADGTTHVASAPAVTPRETAQQRPSQQPRRRGNRASYGRGGEQGWRLQLQDTLGRSSYRLGSSSIDRYRSLGLPSIPLQQGQYY